VAVREAADDRVRSHYCFRNRGTEYVRKYGMKWMSGSTKRQCDRALPDKRPEEGAPVAVGATARALPRLHVPRLHRQLVADQGLAADAINSGQPAAPGPITPGQPGGGHDR
jgi:hypothetical protein